MKTQSSEVPEGCSLLFTQELSFFLAHPSRKVLGKDLSMTEVCAGQTQPWEDEVICIYFLKINKQDKIIA